MIRVRHDQRFLIIGNRQDAAGPHYVGTLHEQHPEFLSFVVHAEKPQIREWRIIVHAHHSCLHKQYTEFVTDVVNVEKAQVRKGVQKGV